MMVGRLTTILTVMSLSSVGAVTIHVPQDQPTIQAGIDSASSGDTVLVTDGVYSGEGNLNIDFEGKLIALMSENGPEATVIDCQHAGRAFYFHSGEDSTARIEGFTIKNGVPPGGYFTGGGIQCESSSLTIIDCIFEDNVVISYTCGVLGGAIYASQSSLHIANCTFRNNLVRDYFDLSGVEAWGGAIAVSQSTLAVDSCLFVGNRAYSGGGIYGSDSSTILLANCTFYANDAYGSALSLTWLGGPDMSTALVENCNMVYGLRGRAVSFPESNSEVMLSCSNVYGNVGGDWVGEIADQIGINGNLSLDPEFCDTADIDLTLNPLSPCLPANNECSALIGALGEGCDCCVDRGNINHDPTGVIDISDLVYLVAYMFDLGPTPLCLAEGDVDGNGIGGIDISDLVYLVDYMFNGGTPPVTCL